MMKSIDLHGLIEEEAISYVLVEIMSLKENEELEIITGNGHVLKDAILELVIEEGLSYKYNEPNYGAIIVWK